MATERWVTPSTPVHFGLAKSTASSDRHHELPAILDYLWQLIGCFAPPRFLVVSASNVAKPR
ncbi:hypothetical protein CEE69_18715 [Rhodopirellula bahusiensis]|uniref:Uncharacterized protein n=1 Tax=Rhodopirellula bahusiensis TaxID=2014065 RepID=A0A2G1W527_9BACT|nr:hypothetical protein CEE69_18715 [Rhodopirellula bahusiensis]